MKRMDQTDTHVSKEHITSRNHNANLHASTKAHTDEATTKLQNHVSTETDELKTQLAKLQDSIQKIEAGSAVKLQQISTQLTDQRDDIQMMKSMVNNRQQYHPMAGQDDPVPCSISCDMGSREVSTNMMRGDTKISPLSPIFRLPKSQVQSSYQSRDLFIEQSILFVRCLIGYPKDPSLDRDEDCTWGV